MSSSAPKKNPVQPAAHAQPNDTAQQNSRSLSNLLRDFFSRRYLLFLVSGGSSALLGVSLRLLFAQFMGYTASVIASYFFSTLAAYALNKRLVFRGQARGTELGRFFVVNVIGLLQTALLSNVFFKVIHWATALSVPVAETLGHATALSTLAVTSFIIHKYWTFSQSNSEGKAPRPD